MSNVPESLGSGELQSWTRLPSETETTKKPEGLKQPSPPTGKPEKPPSQLKRLSTDELSPNMQNLQQHLPKPGEPVTINRHLFRMPQPGRGDPTQPLPPEAAYQGKAVPDLAAKQPLSRQKPAVPPSPPAGPVAMGTTAARQVAPTPVSASLPQPASALTSLKQLEQLDQHLEKINNLYEGKNFSRFGMSNNDPFLTCVKPLTSEIIENMLKEFEEIDNLNLSSDPELNQKIKEIKGDLTDIKSGLGKQSIAITKLNELRASLRASLSPAIPAASALSPSTPAMRPTPEVGNMPTIEIPQSYEQAQTNINMVSQNPDLASQKNNQKGILDSLDMIFKKSDEVLDSNNLDTINSYLNCIASVENLFSTLGKLDGILMGFKIKLGTKSKEFQTKKLAVAGKRDRVEQGMQKLEQEKRELERAKQEENQRVEKEQQRDQKKKLGIPTVQSPCPNMKIVHTHQVMGQLTSAFEQGKSEGVPYILEVIYWDHIEEEYQFQFIPVMPDQDIKTVMGKQIDKYKNYGLFINIFDVNQPLDEQLPGNESPHAPPTLEREASY